jgi:hypothetical protein
MLSLVAASVAKGKRATVDQHEGVVVEVEKDCQVPFIIKKLNP